MPQFRDCEGKVWPITVRVDTLRRVRQVCRTADGQAFDLLSIVSAPSKTIAELIDDPIHAAEALWCCVYEEAKDKGIPDLAAFCSRLDGDAVSEGVQALIEGIIDFCPGPELRKALGWIPARVKELLTEMHRTRAGRIESGGSSTSAPECAESIPAG